MITSQISPSTASRLDPVQRPAASAEVELDPVTREPAALRFPWLSRIAATLESVSLNHWPFRSVEVTGDNVDGAA